MNDRLVLRVSPEEEELQRKFAELAASEADLLQGELDLATLHAELKNFEREYQQVIGTRYAELERIEQQIAEYMAYLESGNDFKPSEDLKKLYREVAKLIHPDLTTDPAEKIDRQKLMAEANQAYEAEDIEKLRSILRSWESRPESVRGEGVGAELIRAILKIAQCRERLRAIQAEIAAVKETELYQLQFQVNCAKARGEILLADMAQDIDEQIDRAQQKLRVIKEKMGAI
jgi:DnaJ-domain-containing protein 1